MIPCTSLETLTFQCKHYNIIKIHISICNSFYAYIFDVISALIQSAHRIVTGNFFLTVKGTAAISVNISTNLCFIKIIETLRRCFSHKPNHHYHFGCCRRSDYRYSGRIYRQKVGRRKSDRLGRAARIQYHSRRRESG